MEKTSLKYLLESRTQIRCWLLLAQNVKIMIFSFAHQRVLLGSTVENVLSISLSKVKIH